MEGGKSTRFHVPLKKLRGLRSLSLGLPNFAPYIPNVLVDGDDGFLPALHTLELLNCDNGHWKMLWDLRETLLGQGKWDSFRWLEVSSSAEYMRQINALFGEIDKNVIWK